MPDSTAVTSAAAWIAGARPRTLPAAVAPVLVGSASAAYEGGLRWDKAALALLVALALQVGVNYANDYSDGVRGTDADRVGPLRLVGSGAASPGTVKTAAVGCFVLAALCGLALAATSGWELIAVGAAAIAAAWFYTGGPRPYGYAGFGELSVFVFFGLVAVSGTTYVQLGRVTWLSVAGGVALGALAAAILVANNLRDIPSDAAHGKRTLAVLLGDRRSRLLYLALLAAAAAVAVLLAGAVTGWAALTLLAIPSAIRAVRAVATGARGAALVPVLRDTGLAELAYAIGLSAGLVIGR